MAHDTRASAPPTPKRRPSTHDTPTPVEPTATAARSGRTGSARPGRGDTPDHGGEGRSGRDGRAYRFHRGVDLWVDDETDQGVALDHKAFCRFRNMRASTIYQRMRVLRRLAMRTEHKPHLEVTRDEIETALNRPLSAAARAAELSHLRGFYGWAVTVGKLTIDPTAGIPRPITPRRLPRPISDEDLQIALEQAPERVRPMLYLAAYAGLRAGEISRVRGEDIVWTANPPRLIVDEGKGGHAGTVPLHPAVAEVLRPMPRQGYLFRYLDGRWGHMAPEAVSAVINRYLRSIGLDATCHQLRHWFGTSTLTASNGNLRVTQELMRHSSPVSTAIYTLITDPQRAEVVNRLPNLGDRRTRRPRRAAS